MILPDPATFYEEACRAFAYLIAAGFDDRGMEESSQTASVTFVGKHVAVYLSLDHIDGCIDCYVTRIVGGKLTRNATSGDYQASLHQFLIKRRKYRGAFREFKQGDASWQGMIQIYACALKALAPEVAGDEAGCLDPR